MNTAQANAGLPHEYLDCGHSPTPHSEHTTGYGRDAQGKKHCYACCAEQDKAQMRAEGKINLYLVQNKTHCTWPTHKFTNWPGSLEFPAHGVKVAKRGGGFGCQRTDAWFIFEGYWWHTVNRGDSQIARCKRTKEKVE
jgi:hypothetical protein